MLKTISAVLLAVSVLAAPALAASSGANAQAGAPKSAAQTTPAKVKTNPLNANAKMSHRHSMRHHRHHRFHKMAVGKAHKSAKVAAKHVTHPAKHG
ncbi:MAG TPA: hypothetical protein VKT76_15975 [Bradyrhizobium sp.]|nr:hypothetical protein [Bradyrhizobium sp.]